MAANWRTIALDAEQIATGELETIRAELALYFLLHDPGDGMAVFTRRLKPGACKVYFSPACHAYTEFIFERHAARRATAPGLLGTTLLVGYPSAVASLLGRPRAIAAFGPGIRQPIPGARIAAETVLLPKASIP